MAEVLLNNHADFTAEYDGEEVVFSSNTVTTRILQGLSAVKTANKEVWVNGQLQYTVVLNNTTGEEITNAVFTDTLDPIIKLDETADVLVNGSAATYAYASNTLTINLPAIGIGEQVTVTFLVLQV